MARDKSGGDPTLRKDGKPRKYLDSRRIKLNPVWLEGQSARDDSWLLLSYGASHYASYFPPEEKIIPEEGMWIRVVEVPHTELALRFEVPPLSMWYARPQEMNCSGMQIGAETVRPKMAVIRTPGGDLHLFPHEYVPVDDIGYWLGCTDGPEVVLHDLGGEPVLDDEQEHALFYVQSRGIDRRDALVMLLPGVLATDSFWLSLHPELAAMFEGVGQPLDRHIALHPR